MLLFGSWLLLRVYLSFVYFKECAYGSLWALLWDLCIILIYGFDRVGFCFYQATCLSLYANRISGAVAFIVSATNQLPSVDTWCILYPSLRPLLRSDIKSVTVLSVLQSLKPPVSLCFTLISHNSLFIELYNSFRGLSSMRRYSGRWRRIRPTSGRLLEQG